jgi:hypothetical protein
MQFEKRHTNCKNTNQIDRQSVGRERRGRKWKRRR